MKGQYNIYNHHKNYNLQIKKNNDFNTIERNQKQNFNIIKEIETYPLEILIK